MSADRCSHHDSWRTVTLLHAMSELWLSQVTTIAEGSALHQTPSPPRHQLNIIQVILCFHEMFCICLEEPVFLFFPQTSAFLPSLDHLRAVRVMTKHLHYFANSSGPNIISELDDLKR